MKKMLFLTCICCSISFVASAQLAASRWYATINIPDPTECYLQFGQDTVRLFSVDMPGNALESMTYTLQNDTLTITKLEGQSPCEVTGRVRYKTTITEKELKFIQLDDACDVRVRALVDQPWKPLAGGK